MQKGGTRQLLWGLPTPQEERMSSGCSLDLQSQEPCHHHPSGVCDVLLCSNKLWRLITIFKAM